MKTPNTQLSTFNFRLSTFIFLLFTFNTYSQSIKGTWRGELSISGMTLPLVFHVDSTENGLISTMDSPSQGAKGIPTNTTVFSNNELLIQMDKIQFIYNIYIIYIIYICLYISILSIYVCMLVFYLYLSVC